ncbi:long-chain-fatty-acid--CoA ligase [Inquilinus sp. OTU3971]|uniref:long-chain-fatty-acid--CoA ligase n=1 Tax=Inquilinus sp. OTU3971 TaxID=3043855 RepID=UPI00313D0E3E
MLDTAAARHPNDICVDFLGQQITYAEVARRVKLVSNGLRRIGVGVGTRVALLLPNSPQFVITFFAVLKAGGTIVNCNPMIGTGQFIRQMVDSRAEIVVTLDLAPLYEKAARALHEASVKRLVVVSLDYELPALKRAQFRLWNWRNLVSTPIDNSHIRFQDLLDADEPEETTPVDSQSVAVLQYTGGTTGTPKAVMLSHRNLLVNCEQIKLWLTRSILGPQRIIAVLPFAHCFGMTAIMNLAISIGGEMVLLPRFKIREFLSALERRRVTMIVGVPALFRAMNEYSKLSRYDLSSLKLGVSGGDALPIAVQRKFEKSIGCPLAEGYGLSECSPVVTCGNPLEGAAKPGSCGLPLPGTLVEIISTKDGVTALPPNTLGEICVTGPQVMLGYWNQPDATTATLLGDRLHTGDVGRMDEDGYLYFSDRLKDVIVVSGYKVYPRAVEEILLTHSAVSEAAVIGVADEARGHVAKAFVVLRRGADVTAEALRRHLAGQLPPMSVPREIIFREDLPKSPMGKILKAELESR